MQVLENIRKFNSFSYNDIRPKIFKSNESANFITSGLSRGCVENCSYCSVPIIYTHNRMEVGSPDTLIRAIEEHVETLPWPKVPDHTHPRFYTYDIGAFCDIGTDYQNNIPAYNKLFKFFIEHPKIMAVFSTKVICHELLTVIPNYKIRILMSITTKETANLMEVNTSNIEDRVCSLDNYYLSEWSVGLLLSPVVIFAGYMASYTDLFKMINTYMWSDYEDSYMFDIKYLKLDKRNLEKESNPIIRQFLTNPTCQIEDPMDPNLIVYSKRCRETSEHFFRQTIKNHTNIKIRYIS